MLYAELIPLTHALQEAGRHVTIETAGTLYLPVHADLMSISPKFASSAPAADLHADWYRRHQRSRHRPDVIRQLVHEFDYQIKFVINSPNDCEEVHKYLAEIPELDTSRVYLMPQGATIGELASIELWLEPYCQQHRLQYCPRRQIEWYGSARGT